MKQTDHIAEFGAIDVIAVIGMAGRFPGAPNVDAFWRNLQDGVESIATFGAEELLAAGVAPSAVADPNYVRARGVLGDVEWFDAGFFGFSPKEAELLDPQQRFFLECAWEALENAAYDPESWPGRIGIYAGSNMNTYMLFNLYGNRGVLNTAGAYQVMLGSDKDYLTTRASYKLGLRGPSVAVQTACSTSLVAVHLACQSLLGGECDMALAGGVSILVPQKAGYYYQEGGILSRDGHCRAFDEQASGSVEGSGVGLVVLKRLEDAIADRDSIRALIRGSSINNDGSLKVGFTAPSVDGQQAVIQDALLVSRVDPRTISYIETHGTGTSIGDPIEIAALKQAFGERAPARGACAIGSVKTNIGHLDAAAGVAGLIKTILALENRMLPPSLHFSASNPRIDFAESPFYVNTEPRPWKSSTGPLRAGVSSFGVGGTNAHVVIEEPPPAAPSGESTPWCLLTLSAKNNQALMSAAANLRGHLSAADNVNLADVAYTLNVGRSAFEHRQVLVCRSVAEAITVLGNSGSSRMLTAVCNVKDRPVAFMFSGQGSQYEKMGAELYERESVFRDELDRCSRILESELDLDIRRFIFSEIGDRPSPDSPRDAIQAFRASGAHALDETVLTQPSLFAIEYSLARLWMTWGISPIAMIGHSIGEYVAACIAGVFSLEDCLRLVAVRARLMQGVPRGAMLAVPLAEDQLGPYLSRGVAMAAVNGPASCVLSGPVERIDEIQEQLAVLGYDGRRLRTSHAFHSEMMEPILHEFASELARVRLSKPRIAYVSNLTGTWIRPEEACVPEYWVRHLREPVRFAGGLSALLARRDPVLLEIGPGNSLTMLARRNTAASKKVAALSSLRRREEHVSDVEFILTSLGRLWLAGVKVDWSAFYSGQQRRRIALPTYPFQRQRYWVEAEATDTAIQPTRKAELAEWFYAPIWKQSVSVRTFSEHRATESAWLLFVDAADLPRRIEERLRRAGGKVITVRPGDGFATLDAGSYSVAPSDVSHYEEVFKRSGLSFDSELTILHMWTVSPAVQMEAATAFPDRSLELGFFSLLALAQSFGRVGLTSSVHLTVVSSQIHSVTGAETRLYPEKAAISGPCRVIPFEFPNATTSMIDIDLPEAGSQSEDQLANRLINEALDRKSEWETAYRSGRAWVRRYEPLPLADKGLFERLRAKGTYLITGGLGAIGLEIALDLSRRVKARLVLVGRSEFPGRDEWDRLLADVKTDAELRLRLSKLKQIEEAGGEALPISADVCDEDQMGRVIQAAMERFGALNGVIHAAGVEDGALIARVSRSSAEAVLKPKIQGALVLAGLLNAVELDFLVFCSSLTAVVGAPGQIAYCAANAFLDAFAAAMAEHMRGLTLSINWDSWLGAGMAERVARKQRSRLPGSGIPVNHPLFDHMIALPQKQLFVSYVSPSSHWVLNEHRVQGTPIFPGAAYLEMIRAALDGTGKGGVIEIEEVFFVTPLLVDDNEEKEIVTVIEPASEGSDWFDVTIRSRSNSQDGLESAWLNHVFGRARLNGSSEPERYRIDELIRRCNRERVDGAAAAEREAETGPRWDVIKSVNLGAGELVAYLELSAEFGGDLSQYKLHPSLLDAATGVAKKYLTRGGTYLPFSYKTCRVNGPLSREIYSYARQREQTDETLSYQVSILDEDGNEIVRIDEYTAKRVSDVDLKLRTLADEQVRSQPASRRLESGGLAPDEGVEVFRRLLGNGVPPQVVVSTKDLTDILERSRAGSLRVIEEAVEQAARERSVSLHPRPDLPNEYVPPRTEREKQMAELWASAIGIEKVGLQDNFFELGGDSVMAIQVASRANRAGFQLGPNLLFQHPTIAELLSAETLVTSAGEDSTSRRPRIDPPPELLEIAGGETQIEDVYHLSPMQHGMLFHSLTSTDRGLYCEQIRWIIDGELDIAAFKGAWARLIARHTILRTAFLWKNLDEPVQFVCRTAPLPWTEADWSSLSPAEQSNRLAKLVEENQSRGFDLMRPPLMRFTLIRIAPGRHRFVWAHHHLLLEGWSISVLLRELLGFYAHISSGRPLSLGPARPYGDYIAWREQRDLSSAESFWRKKLRGFTEPTPLGLLRSAHSSRAGFGKQEVVLVRKAADALREMTRQHQLTLNTVMQGVWGLLLSRYSGNDDVVFGTVVTSRPPELSGSDSMVGLFINNIPLRIRVVWEGRAADWLRVLQGEQSEMRSHEYASLVQIQRWSEVPRGSPMFYSIFVFENMPGADDLLDDPVLRISDYVRQDTRSNFPLTVMVEPRAEPSIQAVYRLAEVDEEMIRRLLSQFQLVLECLALNRDETLPRLRRLLDEEDAHMQSESRKSLEQVKLDKLKKVRLDRTART